MSEKPPEPPPYGALIEAARERAGLSKREAARRVGISEAWWRYLVRGYQKVPGDTAAPADTIARMARGVGVTPELLESGGQHPDAAAILRDTPEDAPAPGAAASGNAPDAAARIFPDDEAAQRLLLRGLRLGNFDELADWVEYRRDRAARGYPQDRQQGTAG
jgi:transcriptional regulator with XRE-family HTH domain